MSGLKGFCIDFTSICKHGQGKSKAMRDSPKHTTERERDIEKETNTETDTERQTQPERRSSMLTT